MRPWRPALLLALLAAAGPAAADADPQALATSRTHVVRTRPRVAPGLETAMPRTAIYGQAVALDLEERFDESAARYRDAEVEFSRLPSTPARQQTLSAWQLKCRWQAQWSRQLALPRQGLRPLDAYASAELGYAYLLKFLAARAFTGRPPLRLALKARALLEDAVRRDASNAAVRLTLATLLQELGDPLGAQRELARASAALARDDALVALRLAAYHAAAGDHPRALEALERVFRRRWGVPELLRWSNEYDRLRGDPRFKRLIESGYRPRLLY
jgi:tetratricopeptide (TPR) repeat protein